MVGFSKIGSFFLVLFSLKYWKRKQLSDLFKGMQRYCYNSNMQTIYELKSRGEFK